MEHKYPLITNAKLTVTNKCQLSCSYCFESKNSKEMSYEVAKDSVDFLANNAKEMGIRPYVVFFGGEPLLRYEDLVKPIISYIRDTYGTFYGIGMTTNGILLDEEKLKFLKENRVSFMLSLDGNKEAHDSCRTYSNGSGSYDDIAENIPNILKYYPLTRARMTLTPANVSELYNSILDVESKGFKDMHILPNVLEEWSDEDIEVAREQMNLYKDYLIKRFDEDEIPLVFGTFKEMFCKIVVNINETEKERYREAYIAKPCNRCGIGCTGNGVIDYEGNIFTCEHASVNADDSNPLYLGTIYEGCSEDRIDKLLEMNSRNLYSEVYNCADCNLNRICTGGCVPNNYSLYKDFTKLPKVYCTWTKILYDTAMEIIRYFDKNKTNELFKDWFYGAVTGGVSLAG